MDALSLTMQAPVSAILAAISILGNLQINQTSRLQRLLLRPFLRWVRVSSVFFTVSSLFWALTGHLHHLSAPSQQTLDWLRFCDWIAPAGCLLALLITAFTLIVHVLIMIKDWSEQLRLAEKIGTVVSMPFDTYRYKSTKPENIEVVKQDIKV